MTPFPITHAGWMSIPNTSEQRACIAKARCFLLRFHKTCATLCACRHWNPLKKRRACAPSKQAGSLSITADRSARINEGRSYFPSTGQVKRTSSKSSFQLGTEITPSASLLDKIWAMEDSKESCEIMAESSIERSDGSSEADVIETVRMDSHNCGSLSRKRCDM
eukprot:CAMPEP_0114369090 /NCGR_PEP_ID=MMETSP0101-20121206/31381_1 /TAXON_ID=38822 ORGANISM="Pteridomonas danica, Strain PT" /NCGR_SAMPLE_ID=MMETSP0101 /ASSEMBLY_ACC=CAM_ASM_000211 /LENGTH=163 /DNA_ID=CAMNT_0001519709 /DNA_START=324 /DNA_END=815 /DNA_ORIENTATION=-